MFTMMQSANNGHPHPGAPQHLGAPHQHPHHAAPGAPGAHPGAHPHLDPRYMDYATAAAANMHHLHDPHALHYASLAPAAVAQAPLQNPSQGGHHPGKRNADSAGLDTFGSSDEDGSMDVKPPVNTASGRGKGVSAADSNPAGKKTKGRVKIKMEFIDNKLRRYTTFSKRKTGIMKKVGSFEAYIVFVL